MNFQDLPVELILKVLSYSKPKDLITSSQVSRRFRTIGYDNSLWQRVNLSDKIVKTELLELILCKGCKSLNLSGSTIFSSFSIHQNSQLRELDLSGVEDVEVSEEILASCSFLEKLLMLRTLTPKMATSICQNSKTLQILDLSSTIGDEDCHLRIIKSCQELKELYLPLNHVLSDLSNGGLERIAKYISPNVGKLNLCTLYVTDNHVKILLSRCNKIKALHLGDDLWF